LWKNRKETEGETIHKTIQKHRIHKIENIQKEKQYKNTEYTK
jgi:hypothetical protein